MEATSPLAKHIVSRIRNIAQKVPMLAFMFLDAPTGYSCLTIQRKVRSIFIVMSRFDIARNRMFHVDMLCMIDYRIICIAVYMIVNDDFSNWIGLLFA